MVENVASSSAAHAKRILDSHLNVGNEKPVSYLPIKTIERIIGITIPAYKSMIESLGNRCSVFSPEESCIDSGAVYAYNDMCLNSILQNNMGVLLSNGWPTTSENFIKKIASEWLTDENPIMPIIRKAFGET
jgi:hypothetical protein